MGVNTISKLKKALPELESEVLIPTRAVVEFVSKFFCNEIVTIQFFLFFLFISEKVRTPPNFADFYSFAFRYCLTGACFN